MLSGHQPKLPSAESSGERHDRLSAIWLTAGCGCKRQHADNNSTAQQAQSGGQDAAHVAKPASKVGIQDDSKPATAMQHVHR